MHIFGTVIVKLKNQDIDNIYKWLLNISFNFLMLQDKSPCSPYFPTLSKVTYKLGIIALFVQAAIKDTENEWTNVLLLNSKP